MKQASGWMEPKASIENPSIPETSLSSTNSLGSIHPDACFMPGGAISIDVIEPGFAEKGAVAVTRAANGEKGSF
jgi:NCS1 family nucleobase:cation symporter-1